MKNLRVVAYCEFGAVIGYGHAKRTMRVLETLQNLGVSVFLILTSVEGESVREHFPGIAKVGLSELCGHVDAWLLDTPGQVPEEVATMAVLAPFRVSLSPALQTQPLINTIFHRGTRGDVSPEITYRFCGLRWAILGSMPEARMPAQWNALLSDVWKVGVLLGGGDNDLLLAGLMESGFGRLKSMQYRVLLGAWQVSNFSARWAKEIAERRIEVVKLAPDESPWGQLADCVLVVTRSGLTPYEAVGMGIPPLIIVGGNGYSRILDDIGAAIHLSVSMVGSTLESLVGRNELLQGLASAGRGKIDGRGAERVGQKIFDLLSGMQNSLNEEL